MWTRRQWLSAALAARIEYRDYSRVLPDELRALARSSYERRNRAIASLTSEAAIRARQAWVRATFWKLAGGEPERSPLNLRTLGSFERDGYRVEKLVYESRPGFHVPANLYLPSAGKPPYPGVLFQMGHSTNGKAAAPYQKCCQGLARLGYVVLAFDPMGQGERIYYPRIASPDNQHTLPGRQLLLAGDSASKMQVWDAVRSLDVLAAHPSVDPARLASTGQSGGGTLTMLLTAVDSRLACAAVSCGNTENFACADFNPPGSTDDAEQNLIASGLEGFDRWDLLYPLAPKPLLVLASARDFFGTYSPRYLSSGREEFDKLARVYATLGAANRIAWDETPAPHALAYFLRTRIYAWFERWLHGRQVEAVAEPAVEPERDQTLWVGPAGNTVADFQSKTPLAIAVAGVRPRETPLTRERLATALRLPEPASAQIAVLKRVPSEGCDIAAVEIGKLPAYLFIPHQPSQTKAPVMFADPRGRAAEWAEGGLYHRLASQGVTLCAVDVRGIGDLAPEASRGAQRYAVSHASDEAYAWAALILGLPLVTQRAADIRAAARALGTWSGRNPVVAADGALAIPALIATAMDPAIQAAYLGNMPVSYRALLDHEEYRFATANIVPGILAVTDLPEIAALAAPRAITLAGVVDGVQNRMPVEAVRKIYRGNVTVVPAPDYSAIV